MVSSNLVLAVGLDLTVSNSLACSNLYVGGPVPISAVIVASALVRPTDAVQPPLPSESKASSRLLGLGAV